MPLTKITVTYGRTQSLPDYCNVRPSVSLEWTLDPREDPEEVWKDLLTDARLIVEEECDAALEDAGRPARFSTEPRYSVVVSTAPNTRSWGKVQLVPPERAVCVVPANQEAMVREWGYMGGGIYPSDGLRWSHVLRLAQEFIATQADRGIEYRLIECRTPDDLRFIPRAPEPEPEPEDGETEPEEQSEYMLSEHEPDPPRDEDDE